MHPKARRWPLGFLIFLVCLVSSNVPLGPSVQRLGRAPLKKSKTCESLVLDSRVTASPQREEKSNLGSPGDPLRGHSRAPTAGTFSIAVESRLTVEEARPRYLELFAPSTSVSGPPPPASDLPTAI
jgi:hypothetical protein